MSRKTTTGYTGDRAKDQKNAERSIVSDNVDKARDRWLSSSDLNTPAHNEDLRNTIAAGRQRLLELDGVTFKG